jgi:cellulose synthase/poly-beta-1,6-N-acetylglucosamine synthase-like glycosyltransferase
MPDPERSPDAPELADLAAQMTSVSARLLSQEVQSSRRYDRLQSAQAHALRVLELLYDDDPGTRRRLGELRAGGDYEAAFTVADPLVSVVIPTYTRVETLIERAIPSALAQTHENIEVIVVGDASPPEVEAAILRLNDPRVSFHNLTVRGPYDEDALTAWHSYGTPGINAGAALARGQWIAPLGDDDAFVPEHVGRLLAAARQHRLEFVYGQLRMILPDGSESILGEFPPRLTQVGLQAAIFHSGLRFVELELGHALFHKPNDWGFVHRLMRTGVRIGMVSEVSVDYWSSQLNHELWSESEAEASAQTDLVVTLQERVLELEEHLAAERRRSGALDAHATGLYRRLEEVRRSRSWRFTAPLRRLRGRQ